MSGYKQFCPVAKAMELLDERWTMLVVRELMAGSHHFNELRRGVPRMSPALLSKRLRTLVRYGVVERCEDGNRVSYRLTAAGQELGPIVESIGRWGVRWVPELGDEDLDPHLLMWDMRRTADHEAFPSGCTVVQFTFSDVRGPGRNWWLVVDDEGADVCDVDPGHPVTVTVEADLRTLTCIWRGDRGWDNALRAEELHVDGPQAIRRRLPRWLRLSAFAPVPRPVTEALPPLGAEDVRAVTESLRR